MSGARKRGAGKNNAPNRQRNRPVFSKALSTGHYFCGDCRTPAKRRKSFRPPFAKGGGALGRSPNSASAEAETPAAYKKRRRGQREPVPPGPGALRGTHAPGGVPRAGGRLRLSPAAREVLPPGEPHSRARERTNSRGADSQAACRSTGTFRGRKRNRSPAREGRRPQCAMCPPQARTLRPRVAVPGLFAGATGTVFLRGKAVGRRRDAPAAGAGKQEIKNGRRAGRAQAPRLPGRNRKIPSHSARKTRCDP